MAMVAAPSIDGNLHAPDRRKKWNPKALPDIQIITSHCRYHIDGGRESFLRYVQYAVLNDKPNAKKWWAAYHEVPALKRSIVNYDDVCLAADIKPAEFMQEIVAAASSYGSDAATLIAASSQPTIVHQTAKSAKRIGGEFAEVAQKDRRMMLEHAGFLPQKAGTTVNVNASAQAGAAVANPGGFGSEMAALAATRQNVQETLKAETRQALQAAFTDEE